MDGEGLAAGATMSRGCCGGRAVRLVRVGPSEVGLTGVDQVLNYLYLEGWSPGDAGLAEALVEAARQAGNYVPSRHEAAYGAALAELFRQFCAAQTASHGHKIP